MAIYKGNQKIDGGYPIATQISSSSTNSEVAGAKAVYDATLDNYSTTEQVVGTWTNGKPIYRQLLQQTTTSSTTEKYVDFIPRATLDEIISIKGAVNEGTSTNQNCVAVPYWKSSSDYANVYYSGASGRLYFQSGNVHGYGKFNVFVEYTKTTD